MVTNFNNYGSYVQLAKTRFQVINVNELTKENISSHILWIMNILRDGIETDYVQSMKLQVTFADNYVVNLYLPDYFFNLIFWSMMISIDQLVCARHIYFPENMTNKYNKEYIDNWFVDCYYGKINKIKMNNIINDTLAYFRYVDEFSMWICNTLNLSDDMRLMKECKEAYDIMHADLSGIPIENRKDEAMKLTNRLIEIIKQTDYHCLGEMLRTGEGINPKQYKENCVNIGPKPNGDGGIYPIPINSNLLYLGALRDLAYAVIEYSSGRIAQIINNTNVGLSGSFARILKLNCMDSRLHEDPNYVCNTKNFLEIEIKNDKILKLYDGMTYRTNPNGVDYVLNAKDHSLIGRKLFFRSAITCASNARGEGVCHACYGKLAFINSDVNIGIMAAEEFSSVLTQMLLSAKHLLEAVVLALKWMEEFFLYFKIEYNEIKINDNCDLTGCDLVIDLDNDIDQEDDYDNLEFNHYITTIKVKRPDGSIISIDNEQGAKLYITLDFNKILRNKQYYSPDDDIVYIPLSELGEKDKALFFVDIDNNELATTLNKLQKIINNTAETSSYTKDAILQKFMETIIDSKLYINATHCSVILSNQFRSTEDILEMPVWENKDEAYRILPLNGALKYNASITKTLSFSYIDKMLTLPLSFKKYKPSEMDLFFMVQPQQYLNNQDYISNDPIKHEGLRQAIRLLDPDMN